MKTTHRIIQVSQLLDTLLSKSAQCRKAANNLVRIRNEAGAGHYLARAVRYERVANHCAVRLAHA